MEGLLEDTLGLTIKCEENPIQKKNKKVNKKVIDGVELSEEQVDEIKDAFVEFDIDGDGTITTKVRKEAERLKILMAMQELGMVMRRLGDFQQRMS